MTETGVFILIGRVFRDYFITNRRRTVDELKYGRPMTDDRRQFNRCFSRFDRLYPSPRRARARCANEEGEGHEGGEKYYAGVRAESMHFCVLSYPPRQTVR